MQTLDFETLTFEQLSEWAERESEIFEQLGRLLKGASDSERLKIAAIAILEAEMSFRKPNIPARIKHSIEAFFLKNTSPTTRECSRLIDEFPFSDGKLQLANFIIKKFREDSEDDISELGKESTIEAFDLDEELGEIDLIPY